jgi:hypothetical protein
MTKRLFQILDEMNIKDGEQNTATVGVINHFVSAQKAKGGGHVTMGVPENVVMDLVFNKTKLPILLIIDLDEYEKIKKATE